MKENRFRTDSRKEGLIKSHQELHDCRKVDKIQTTKCNQESHSILLNRTFILEIIIILNVFSFYAFFKSHFTNSTTVPIKNVLN